jgi:shikimate O-hydroxycinnamoyltransferase
MHMIDRLLPLSSIDHVFTGVGAYEIGFVFAYQDTIDPDRLRSSLERTLEDFWPLRSKLVRLSDHAHAFQPADEGLVFETARSASTFDSADDVTAFVDSVHTVEGEPLTKIKLTQTPQGSVLGVSISHALVDGFSYFHFLSSWSRIHHDQRFLPPVHQRELLTPKTSTPRELVTPDEVLTRSGFFWVGKRHPVARDQLSEERLLLSKEAINELLAEARQDCQISLFPNDVLTAYLWKSCITRWYDGSGNSSTFVTCPVDFRRILRAVPRTYFGCAICGTTVSLDYDSLVSASLGELALLVRQAVARVKQEYVSGALETLERLRQQRGLPAMEEIHVRHPQHGMVVSNISRLPIQSLDFGAGIPIAFQALPSADRGAAILPAEDGVDIRIY